MIRYDNFLAQIDSYGKSGPFDHCIVDNFFEVEAAMQLSREFPDYDSPKWYCYDNPLENKKALNEWNSFPAATYAALNDLQSRPFLNIIEEKVGTRLITDPGLHGGGWHIHGTNGNLNPHLDYSIHPKLGLQRRLNIIIYLSYELKPNHGGFLGLWRHSENSREPGELGVEIQPVFNRAVLFDTTQNSWHGMSQPLRVEEGIYRKSLAVYYLCEPMVGADERSRALYAPRVNQKGDPEVARIIRLRADSKSSHHVYKIKKRES